MSAFRIIVSIYWKQFVLLLTPLILLPLLVAVQTPAASCGFVILLMSVYWVTEALPLPVTSLIPVVLFPLLGVLSTSEVCMQYLQDTNMMFVASLMMAIAVEETDLHKRIALRVLIAVKGNPNFLLLGMMAVTMFISMWIINTAATAMMLPIAAAILEVLGRFDVLPSPDAATSSGSNQTVTTVITSGIDEDPAAADVEAREPFVEQNKPAEEPEVPLSAQRREIAYMLAMAYASGIGGSATINGSTPNVIYVGLLETEFGENTGMTYATWMAFNLPCAVLVILATWLWLQYLYIGIGIKSSPEDRRRADAVVTLIKQQYADMGPTTFSQAMTIVLFAAAIVLWFMRAPEFMPGWGHLFKTAKVKDATTAVGILVMFFIIPSKLDFVAKLRHGDYTALANTPSILQWKVVEKKLPWGVMILMGGSYSIALALQKSLLSEWLGDQLHVLHVLPQFFIVFIITVMASMITELAANTTVCSILVPVVINLAVSLKIHPIYLTLPCALASTMSYMLPSGNPPSALALGYGKYVTTKEMMKAGFVTKVLHIVIMLMLLNSLGYLIFDLGTYPSWAPQQLISLTIK